MCAVGPVEMLPEFDPDAGRVGGCWGWCGDGVVYAPDNNIESSPGIINGELVMPWTPVILVVISTPCIPPRPDGMFVNADIPPLPLTFIPLS